MKLNQSFGMSTKNSKTNLIARSLVALVAALTVSAVILSAHLATKSAQAQEAVVPPNYCFSFNSGTGVITTYYPSSSCPQAIIIPSSINGRAVVGMSDYAFHNMQLTSVTIPNSVTTIGANSFGDNQLTSVTIPSSVTTIGANSFSDNQLTSVTIESPATSVGHGSFEGNPLIETMTIGTTTYTEQSPTTDPACFSMADSTVTDYFAHSALIARDHGVLCGRDVIIPDGVTAIGSDAFKSNHLTSVSIPDDVTSIGSFAFSYNQLTSITIPDSIDTLGDGAFYGNQLNSVAVESSSLPLGHTVFVNNPIETMTIGTTTYTEQSPTTDPACFSMTDSTVTDYFAHSALIARDHGVLCGRDVIIPDGVTSIQQAGFSGSHLTSITIPDSVTTIGQGVFSGNQLTSLTIPDNVTTIESGAFQDNQLTSVTIPDSVTTTGYSIFSGNPITNLYMGGGITDNSFLLHGFAKGMLEEMRIGDGITEIPSGAFNSATKLKNVHIPRSVTSIGSGAFSNNQLTSVIIHDSVISIGSSAFSGNQLTSITIPDSVTSLGGGAFSGNPIISLHIGDGLTDISIFTSAFNKGMLENLHIGSGFTQIQAGAFAGGRLKNVHISDSITSIGIQAFSNNQLTSVTIPDSVASIASNAFAYNQLTSVILGSGITSLTGDEGFARQATYEVDESGYRIDSTLAPLPTLTHIYTSDPSNPHDLEDLLECGDLFATGEDVCTGYLINPAQVTLSFQSSSGSSLQDTMTLTGQMPDGTALINYSREFIQDLMLNQDFTQEQVSELFYRIGDTIELPELPTIPGYQAPPVQSLALGSADTPIILAYLSDEQIDQGYTWSDDGSVVAPASAGADDEVTGGESLADTGVSQWGVVGLGVMSLVLGLVGVSTLRKKQL